MNSNAWLGVQGVSTVALKLAMTALRTSPVSRMHSGTDAVRAHRYHRTRPPCSGEWERSNMASHHADNPAENRAERRRPE
jgi:hypothetical protein